MEGRLHIGDKYKVVLVQKELYDNTGQPLSYAVVNRDTDATEVLLATLPVAISACKMLDKQLAQVLEEDSFEEVFTNDTTTEH